MTNKAEPGHVYQSTKTYGHDRGFSCAFRQWRAESHCRLAHGYSLGFKFVFESQTLDVRNWVCDFGGFASLKGLLEDTFDHTLLVADDDPEKELLLQLDRAGVARVVMVENTGCEETARLVFETTEIWLRDAGYGDRVKLRSVEVSEHGANSALYINNTPWPVQA